MQCGSRQVILLLACAAVLLVAPADAALQPLDCPVLGWNEADYSITSDRHPLDERAVGWDSRYQNNIDYRWQVWLNANVDQVRFVFDRGAPPDPMTGDPGRPGFDLEPGTSPKPIFCHDSLTISGKYSITLCGNRDQNHTVEFVTSAIPVSFGLGQNDNYVNLRFRTNDTVTRQGFTIKKIRYHCYRMGAPAGSASNVSRLHANGQRDGVLAGPKDIRYLSTVQEADKPLILILRPDTRAALTDHADYDLYASPTYPTTTPGPSSFMWSSVRGRVDVGGVKQMLDDVIVIEPVGYPRYIYYAVYWSTAGGSGGFRVYDNTVSNKLTFRVGTDFDDRADPTNWEKLQWALRMAAAGLYNATDGVAWLSGVSFWHAGGDVTSDCGGDGCDLIYQKGPYASGSGGLAVCTATACHPKGDFFKLGARILFGDWRNAFDNPDGPLVESEVAAHEFGHCLYGFPHAYSTYGQYACGHSLMVWAYSPEWRHLRDYCTGDLTTGNHGKNGTEPTSILPTAGEWQQAAACDPAQFTVYTPGGTPPTPDPEAFETSDIWSLPAMFSIKEMN